MGLGSALPAVVSLQIGRLGFSSSDAGAAVVAAAWAVPSGCLAAAAPRCGGLTWFRLRCAQALSPATTPTHSFCVLGKDTRGTTCRPTGSSLLPRPVPNPNPSRPLGKRQSPRCTAAVALCLPQGSAFAPVPRCRRVAQ